MLCIERGADIVRLASKLDSQASGLRVHAVAGAVAVAYCKTAYIYGLCPRTGAPGRANTTDFGSVEFAGPSLNTRSLLIPGSVEANQLLAEYEVLGMFCLMLKRVASLRNLVLVDWREAPDDEEICPAWCYERNRSILLIRPRATWHHVNRMVVRYSSHVLLA
ncbi:hypothetical protein C6P86_23645 [Burkholderia multivorans]|nr:hypothetical protein C6P86_23645 [Burkholderia multivorans]PRE77073.1 hypothetical protein C6Q00_27570 [Burkholderia multivorans]PRG17290.1 hypothetical protein C6T57_26265 [Burkholderia multivorans]